MTYRLTWMILLVVYVMLVTSCQFENSPSNGAMAGIETKEAGLTADQIFVTDGEKGLETRRFSYGQKVFTNFKKLKGFTTEVVSGNEVYYPDMSVNVTSAKGDTLLRNTSLLGGKAVAISTETLHGHVILAAPIYSDESYTIEYRVFDTKSDASLWTKMPFNVEPNDAIIVNEGGLTCNEAYIYNQDKAQVIADTKVKFGENLLFDFQGLKGYTIIDGKVRLGISVKVTTANGTVMLDDADYFDGQTLSHEEVQQGVASTLALSKGQIASPVTWHVRIWDKESGAQLTAETELNVR